MYFAEIIFRDLAEMYVKGLNFAYNCQNTDRHSKTCSLRTDTIDLNFR